MEDNWKHRSAEMRCGTCMYFVEKINQAVQRWHQMGVLRCEGHTIGRCRRCAPTMKGWPVVFSDDWCGDHKIDENKI